MLNLYVYEITLLDPLRRLKQEAGTTKSLFCCFLQMLQIESRLARRLRPKLQNKLLPGSASSGFHQGPHPPRPLGKGGGEGRRVGGLDSCTIVLIPWSAGASLRLRSLPDRLYPTPAPASLKVHMTPHPGGHRKAKEVSCVRNALFGDKALLHSPAWPQDQQSLAEKSHSSVNRVCSVPRPGSCGSQSGWRGRKPG